MLIPLSDPIWSRLYGPYGVQDVNRVLGQLEHVWTARNSPNAVLENAFSSRRSLSRNLCRAAVALADGRSAPYHQTRYALIFFSGSAVRRAQRPGIANMGYRWKLAVTPETWLPSLRLRPDDMQTLARLEIWFSENAEEIATACLEAVTADDAHLRRSNAGFCGLRGCLPQTYCKCGPMATIGRKSGKCHPQRADIATLTALWHRLNDKETPKSPLSLRNMSA